MTAFEDESTETHAQRIDRIANAVFNESNRHGEMLSEIAESRADLEEVAGELALLALESRNPIKQFVVSIIIQYIDYIKPLR